MACVLTSDPLDVGREVATSKQEWRVASTGTAALCALCLSLQTAAAGVFALKNWCQLEIFNMAAGWVSAMTFRPFIMSL